MSAAPVRPSTPYRNAAPAIIAHPLALQVNRASIFIYSILSWSKPMGGLLFFTILSIKPVPTNEYAATLQSVTAWDRIMPVSPRPSSRPVHHDLLSVQNNLILQHPTSA